MEKNKQSILRKAMQENGITANDLIEAIGIIKNYGGIPQIANGDTLPLELRYADNSVSKTVQLHKKATAVHCCGLDVALHEPPIPLPFEAARKYCAQMGMKLLSREQALIICAQKETLNTVLKAVLAEPLREYIYWIDGKTTASHMALALDLRTGTVREFRKTESFRVRPVNF